MSPPQQRTKNTDMLSCAYLSDKHLSGFLGKVAQAESPPPPERPHNCRRGSMSPAFAKMEPGSRIPWPQDHPARDPAALGGRRGWGGGGSGPRACFLSPPDVVVKGARVAKMGPVLLIFPASPLFSVWADMQRMNSCFREELCEFRNASEFKRHVGAVVP